MHYFFNDSSIKFNVANFPYAVNLNIVVLFITLCFDSHIRYVFFQTSNFQIKNEYQRLLLQLKINTK